MDFSRILCSHEHFVALNLPSLNPQNHPISENQFYSGSSSPTPSVKSTDSQNSFVSHGKNLTKDLYCYFFPLWYQILLSKIYNVIDLLFLSQESATLMVDSLVANLIGLT